MSYCLAILLQGANVCWGLLAADVVASGLHADAAGDCLLAVLLTCAPQLVCATLRAD
jgi:hypothetical protein